MQSELISCLRLTNILGSLKKFLGWEKLECWGEGIFTFALLYSQYNTVSTIQSVLGVVGLVGHNNDRRRPTKSHALHVTLMLRCANLTPLPTRANSCNKSQPFVSALYKEKLGYLSSIKLELSTMKGAGL